MYLDGVATEGKKCPVIHFWRCQDIPEKLKGDIETAGFGAEARQAFTAHWVPKWEG